MSTPCELIIYDKSKNNADQVAKSILQESKRLEKKYNYYDNKSYLSQINTREINILDTETKNLLSRAKQYYKLTEKTFDITVATIKEIYSTQKTIKSLSDHKATLLQYVGCEHFEIKRDKIYFDNEFTKIDFGGFVKEYAVDRASKIVKRYKIKSALINFGGDIYAVGKKPNNEKFKIGIKDPSDRSKYITFIELLDQALTTSASYERSYQIENQNFSHIISKNDITVANSVTVISDSCVESGVFSTSLMINSKLKTKNRVIMF
jgi:thiamine biosynthesis lipoprotein